ncbi:MAG: hypothetical protein LAP87_04645 [Acidobacteriia bacterium]|nr:hypothetical protein [Terriglobia bacterium]
MIPYQAPVLDKIGKAEEVIRGILSTGTDIDGQSFTNDFEFLDDRDDASGR